MFNVIGERINTSRKAVREAVEKRDETYIQEDVKKQEAAGAAYIDVNAGACIGYEMEAMLWLLEVIQDAVNLPLCLDSPDPRVLEKALSLADKRPIVNSISLEKDRYEPMMEFLKGQTCGIVALCMDDTGMPTSADQVVRRAGKLIDGLEKVGFEQGQIYIDPLIQPIATACANGPMALAAVRSIAERHPQVHFACGSSNVSYGLPHRKLLNRAFLTLLMANGLDGAILDPLDTHLMATIKAAEALLAKDDYCGEYLTAFRKKQLVE